MKTRGGRDGPCQAELILGSRQENSLGSLTYTLYDMINLQRSEGPGISMLWIPNNFPPLGWEASQTERPWSLASGEDCRAPSHCPMCRASASWKAEPLPVEASGKNEGCPEEKGYLDRGAVALLQPKSRTSHRQQQVCTGQPGPLGTHAASKG